MVQNIYPQGTPPVLIPFIVCIETISNLIRPGILAVQHPDLNEHALSDDAYVNVDGACNAYMALTRAIEHSWPELYTVGLKGNILCMHAQFGRQWSVQRNMFKLHQPI